MSLLTQTRHSERMNYYLCALLAHGYQFLGGIRSLHGQEFAAHDSYAKSPILFTIRAAFGKNTARARILLKLHYNIQQIHMVPQIKRC